MSVGPIVQHGYVVADAAKTASAWAAQVGVGPFYLIDQVVDDYVYRGRPMDLRLRVGVSYWGDTQIELIELVDGGDSLYAEAVSDAPGKLNHYAVMVPDIDAEVRDHDLARRVLHTGGTPGLRFLYLENYLPDGSHLELMQASPSILQAFEGMKGATRAWDGDRPVRSLDDLAEDLGALPSSSGVGPNED
jgi:hypothetical protein